MSCVIGPFGVRRGPDWGSTECSGVSRRPGTAVVTAVLPPPGAAAVGSRKTKRIPPAFEGGITMPAAGAALVALVNLPARPVVPASSRAAGPHDSPGSVRRAVLAADLLGVLVGGGSASSLFSVNYFGRPCCLI